MANSVMLTPKICVHNRNGNIFSLTQWILNKVTKTSFEYYLIQLDWNECTFLVTWIDRMSRYEIAVTNHKHLNCLINKILIHKWNAIQTVNKFTKYYINVMDEKKSIVLIGFLTKLSFRANLFGFLKKSYLKHLILNKSFIVI